jgi:hypothetical protein
MQYHPDPERTYRGAVYTSVALVLLVLAVKAILSVMPAP